MANPTLVESHLANGAGSWTPTWSSAPASGDLLIVCGTSHEGVASSGIGAVWTQPFAVIGRWLFYRFADGTSDDTLDVNFLATTNWVGANAKFQNVSGLDIPTPATDDQTSAHSCVAPTATPAYKDDLLLTFHTGGNSTASGEVHLSLPSGHTLIQSWDTDTPESSHWMSGVLSYKQLAGCSATGTVTSTDTSGDTLNRRTGFTMLLEADPPTPCRISGWSVGTIAWSA